MEEYLKSKLQEKDFFEEITRIENTLCEIYNINKQLQRKGLSEKEEIFLKRKVRSLTIFLKNNPYIVIMDKQKIILS